MEKGHLALLYCKHWPHIGCTSITELKCWGQGLSRSMIPHTRQISETKGLHVVLKVFGAWIWVRKEGRNWESEPKENNEECFRSLSCFLCEPCPVQETNRKVTLTFDERSMKLTLYSSWTFTSKHLANKTLKATQASQFGTSSKEETGTGWEEKVLRNLVLTAKATIC